MTRANFTVCLCVISGALFGCDTDKVARLERQNQELQALIQRQQVAANLELQSKDDNPPRFHKPLQQRNE
jgi:hypothetical protein